ncbi:MAG: hypothetical protein AB7P99_03335 [Vicinamibacterales bacterium]
MIETPAVPAVSRRSALQWVRGIAHQYGYRLVLGQLPRLYYGNDAGFSQNFRAGRELRALRARAPQAGSPGDARPARLRQEGFLPLGKPYAPALVAAIRSRVAELVMDPAASLPVGPRIKDAIRGIVDPLERIPEIAQLLSDDIQGVLRGYFGTHFRVEHVRVWRNVHVPDAFARQDVYSNLWHNDQDPVTLLRLFVYMTDGVTRETGATNVHSIAATKQIIRRGYLRRRAILPPARRILEDAARIQYFEGDAGSACLLNPQLCLHRATVPRAGAHRDMIQFTIAPSGVPLADDWHRRMPPDAVMHAMAPERG